MRRFKINSAAEVSPSQFENTVDREFLQDLGSVITLEDGSSLDLSKAKLLYNPNTKKIQISDSDNVPPDFIQLATLTLTPDKPEVSADESFPEPSEEMPEETEAAEETTSEGEEETPEFDDAESGDFFQ